MGSPGDEPSPSLCYTDSSLSLHHMSQGPSIASGDKISVAIKDQKEIVKRPELEAGQLHFPPLLCGTSGPPFQAGRGLWHRFPMPGSQVDVAGTEREQGDIAERR